MFTTPTPLPPPPSNDFRGPALRSRPATRGDGPRRTNRGRRPPGRLIGFRGLLVTVAAAAVGAVALAACAPGSEITVRDPWIRLTDPNRPLGGFMIIVNGGAADDALVGAESPDFGAIELHETVPVASEASPMPSDHGMRSPMPSSSGMAMTMRPVAEIPIPARGEQVLQPGGYHLMLTGPTRSLVVGDVVELTLRFKSGRSVTIEVPLRAP